ncbi:hypothetical protein N803_00930 [Knoellia subterranea KCTC 19937]|uniref:Uncharacterized protein n=1 Tax=Knoellia subterranea KCTC 19937 TaxID=1385521 RepID=A0A0A0JU26_9MICO|nr:hypothetical protein N803_00930 [Knoellia subterranea KCTC 19937]
MACASPIQAPRTTATGMGVPPLAAFLRLAGRAGARRFAGREEAVREGAVRERAEVVERVAMLRP